jgi:hypothetical protein
MKTIWKFRLRRVAGKMGYAPTPAWVEAMAKTYYGKLSPLNAFFAEWNSDYPTI